VEVGPFVALAVLALLTGVGQFLWPNRAKRISGALAEKPRVLVQEAHGAVRLTGRVRRIGELLRAPVSGRPCVAYQIVVDVPTRSGGQGIWRRWVDTREARPFMVADESGEARIDTSGPFFMALIHDRSESTDGLGRYPGKHRALSLFLESTGLRPVNWLGRWKSLHYTESVLEEGALVSVGGASAREVDPNGDRAGPRSPPERLVLRGTEDLPLLISDGVRDA
jgi:uncharacterized protein YjeT (DUF2065 family)